MLSPKSNSIIACIVAVALPLGAEVFAQEATEMPIEIEAPEDPMQLLLNKHKGKKVSLILESGSEIGGTVADVSFDSVQLREVTGKELFDATVRIDQVAAVIQRRESAPGK